MPVSPLPHLILAILVATHMGLQHQGADKREAGYQAGPAAVGDTTHHPQGYPQGLLTPMPTHHRF